jgi:hypothetical protein
LSGSGKGEELLISRSLGCPALVPTALLRCTAALGPPGVGSVRFFHQTSSLFIVPGNITLSWTRDKADF